MLRIIDVSSSMSMLSDCDLPFSGIRFLPSLQTALLLVRGLRTPVSALQESVA